MLFAEMSGQVTRLLSEWRAGDARAIDQLVPLLYGELRGRAARVLAGRNATLGPTELVHEAFERLARSQRIHWSDRAHFLAAAALAMRSVAIDAARARLAEKRGGDQQRVTLTDLPGGSARSPVDTLALDGALQILSERDERQARIVVLRYYGGLSNDETAEVIGVSPATVKREWRVARAWLATRLSDAA